MTDLAVAVAVTDSAGLKTSASSTITVSAATTINVGQITVLPTTDSGKGNLMIAQSITVAQAATLQSLSFYVDPTGVAGQLRLGTYNSVGALVAQTAAFTAAAGWNTQPVLTPLLLSSGSYAIVYLASSNSLKCRINTALTGSGKASFTFGPMPATFPTATSSIAGQWSFYGTFSIAPPPPPGTPIGVGLSSVSVGKPPNANSVVGAVNVTTSGGGSYTGTLTLGGTDAAKFALTHGGVLPCNLVVGPTDIPAGNYSINLTAS